MQTVDKKYFLFNKGINTEAPLVGWPEGYTIDEQNFDLLIDGSRRRRPGLAPEADDANPPIVSPAAITLTGQIVTTDDGDLAWTDGQAVGGPAIVSYKLYRKDDTGNPYNLITTTANDVFTYLDNDLTDGVSYTYYVLCTDLDGGTAISNEVTLVWNSTPITFAIPFINLDAEYGDMTGWARSAPGLPQRNAMEVKTNAPNLTVPQGSYCFGGIQSQYGRVYQTATINTLTEGYDAIDAGNTEVVLNWIAGTYDQANPDNPAIKLHFRNQAGTIIGTAFSAKYFTWTGSGTIGFHFEAADELVAPVPPLTRSITMELQCNRNAGTNNDAMIDDITIEIRQV
jgi:hypothetical protein